MVIIIIQIMYLLICIAEAWLEKIVIYLKNPKAAAYLLYNDKEHFRSAVYAISVGVGMAAIPSFYGDFYATAILVPLMLVIRRIGFDVPLKLFRGLKIRDITGNGWLDTNVRNILGWKGGWIELLICMAVVGVVNWLA